MSKTEEKFSTIREYFESILDNKKCRIIKVIPREIWGKSKTQMARIKIYLPNEICGSDIRDLRKWHLELIAIPWEEIEKIQKEEKSNEIFTIRK